MEHKQKPERYVAKIDVKSIRNGMTLEHVIGTDALFALETLSAQFDYLIDAVAGKERGHD